jgi:AraC-like DNA-binding protein
MLLTLPSGRFPGTVTTSREAAGLVLTETNYLPNQRLRKHCHQYACFVAVIQGSFAETVGRITRNCRPSTLIFRPFEEQHEDHFAGAGGRCLTVEITTHWLDRWRTHSLLLQNSAEFRSPSLSNLTARLYQEFHEPDPFSSLAIEGLVLELMVETSRCTMRSKTESTRVHHAREIIHEHFSENLSLAGIAQMVGAHPAYLAREFRRRYQCSVGEYIRRCRVEAACLKLADPDIPLVEVALSSGFTDQSHFSKTFKRLIGTSPTHFRTTLRHR